MSNDTKHTPALPQEPTASELQAFADWCKTPQGQTAIIAFGWREGAHYCQQQSYAIQTGYKVRSGAGPTLLDHYRRIICNDYADLSRRHAEAVRALAYVESAADGIGPPDQCPVADDELVELVITGAQLAAIRAVLAGNPLPADPVREMVAALEDVKEFLEGRADAEYHPGIERAYPNAEMVLLNTVDNALASAKRVKQNPNPRYVVDGTSDDGTLQGDGEQAPFYVFDTQEQRNIAGPFNSRAEGEAAIAKANGGAS